MFAEPERQPELLDRASALLAQAEAMEHRSVSQLAGVYALQGKTRATVAILRRAAELGLPSYPLVERDPSLDRAREDPEFLRLAEAAKARWLSYQRELAK